MKFCSKRVKWPVNPLLSGGNRKTPELTSHDGVPSNFKQLLHSDTDGGQTATLLLASHAAYASYPSSCFVFVKYSLELWQEILTDFIKEMSLDPTEQWIVMGNSLGGLLTLMLTESLQEGRKASGSH